MVINRILGRAYIDSEFWQALQQDPLAALEAEGFELSAEEQAAFKEIEKQQFSEFCLQILERLAPDEWY